MLTGEAAGYEPQFIKPAIQPLYRELSWLLRGRHRHHGPQAPLVTSRQVMTRAASPRHTGQPVRQPAVRTQAPRQARLSSLARKAQALADSCNVCTSTVCIRCRSVPHGAAQGPRVRSDHRSRSFPSPCLKAAPETDARYWRSCCLYGQATYERYCSAAASAVANAAAAPTGACGAHGCLLSCVACMAFSFEDLTWSSL